jgi:putative oxidoreductase
MSDSKLASRWIAYTPALKSVLRIVVAFVFIQHGTEKILGWPAAVMPGGGTADLTTLPGVAGIIEMVGGALVLVGLFTRPVAFILSGEMAVAYFYGHAPRGFWPTLNLGELAVLYCFVWLYISAAGPGPLSLDAVRGRTGGQRT